MDSVLLIVIILVASILQTSTGFGFSILATPFLLLLFAPNEAIQINLLLSLVISILLYTKIKKDVEFQTLKRLIIGSIAGLPLGMLLFLLLDVEKLKLWVSIVLFILTLLLIAKLRVKQNKNRDIFVGTLSGLFTTSMGMPGPPLLLYFASVNTNKEKLRGTTLAFYLFIYSISLIIQLLFAGTTSKMWIASGLTLPFVFIGLFLGQLLFRKMNQQVFQKLVYALLLFTAIYLLL
ncbi:sulfite exporter TauE/SafE family protein [Gracilibacillus marinus]|uniref:Probable membrane transporter protein n=1 Tax=Gracilibacillus marinus TaxID=630535 RepID=A0ABV8VU79_9BACI